jgi:cation diffusion facilitator CzcD-associated flavoprotein CzcO
MADDPQLLSAVIIGSGFSGLGAGFKLKQAGFDDFVILERAQAVGGVWRDNTYPGCACDVPSHLYSFSFAPKADWSRLYAPQGEIVSYLEDCATRFGLRAHLRFGADVTQARFDDATLTWTVTTRAGRTFRARTVIAGLGGLSTPSVPALPGRFEGPSFHTAAWNHAVSLDGKRVAIVGSAASAVQVIPSIVGKVARLDVYQRTPSWVLPRPDRAIAPWLRALFSKVPLLQALLRLFVYLLLEARIVAFTTQRWMLERFTRDQALAPLHDAVKDPARRAQLTPDYTPGCKRLLLSNDYYPALARPEVDLVTDPIASLHPRGVVTRDGTLREVDVVIYATGFAVQAPVPRGLFFGRAGVDLVDAWAQGPEAYLGISVAGFPNLFLLVGPNTGLGHTSMVLMIEAQVAYVVQALLALRARPGAAFDVKPRAQRSFVDEVQAALDKTVWASGCSSWYRNDAGRITALWPGSTWAYRRRTARFSPDPYQTLGPP